MTTDHRPRPQRPILLLDIDGVIVLLGSGDRGETFEATVAGFPVEIALAARERLSRLASAFAIVWASGWMKDGAEALGPLVGLHDLPFLRFDPDADRDAATYKLPVVQRFARDRPLAWVDDELSAQDVTACADSRQHPTLLLQPDPRVGLVDDHVVALLAFAQGLGSSAGGVDEA